MHDADGVRHPDIRNHLPPHQRTGCATCRAWRVIAHIALTASASYMPPVRLHTPVSSTSDARNDAAQPQHLQQYMCIYDNHEGGLASLPPTAEGIVATLYPDLLSPTDAAACLGCARLPPSIILLAVLLILVRCGGSAPPAPRPVSVVACCPYEAGAPWSGGWNSCFFPRGIHRWLCPGAGPPRGWFLSPPNRLVRKSHMHAPAAPPRGGGPTAPPDESKRREGGGERGET